MNSGTDLCKYVSETDAICNSQILQKLVYLLGKITVNVIINFTGSHIIENLIIYHFFFILIKYE